MYPSLINDEVGELMQLLKKKIQTKTSILILNLLIGVNSVVTIAPLAKNQPPHARELFRVFSLGHKGLSDIGTMFEVSHKMSVSLKLHNVAVFVSWGHNLERRGKIENNLFVCYM